MRDNVLDKISEIVARYKVERVLLFGSRARGDHSDTSDYDIAIFGDELSLIEQALLCGDIEDIETLKKIDVVFVNENLNDAFTKNIKKEGIIVYEQVRNQEN